MPPEPTFSTIPPQVDALLARLHVASKEQESAIDADELRRIKSVQAQDPSAGHALLDKVMEDKFIALDRDKSLLVHQMVLGTGATRVVEVGTSYGVSTIYLALAVAHNARVKSVKGTVIATEKEEQKAAVAREHWHQAGIEVEKIIDFRIGDLTETLREEVGEVDLVLLDIWPHVAVLALKQLLPHLKPGAVILTDNVIQSGDRYGPLFDILRDVDGPFTSVCLPYAGGFEMSVFKGR